MDGVGAMAKLILASPVRVGLLAIAPATNIPCEHSVLFWSANKWHAGIPHDGIHMNEYFALYVSIDLLEQAPAVVDNVDVFAMSGSVHRGYDNSTTPDAGGCQLVRVCMHTCMYVWACICMHM
jgi:hypothetical protein